MQSQLNNGRIPHAGNVAGFAVPYTVGIQQSVANATISAPFRETVGSRDFLCTQIGIMSTEEFDISIRDVAQGENLTSDRINTRSLVGTSAQPFRLPKSWLFGANSQIEIVAENLSANTDVIFIVFQGVAIPENLLHAIPTEIRERHYLPYFIPLINATVNAQTSSTTSPSVTVGHRTFYWTHIGTHAPTVEMTILARESASGEGVMRDRVHSEALSSTEDVPYRFEQPFPVVGSSAIFGEVENLHASTNERLSLTVGGYIDRR